MREGMFRVVKSKERIPANILRLQQVYDREIMAGRPKRSNTPKGSEEKNSKKPGDQTKSSDEGPSTPSKTKKPSLGAKGTPPKPKPSSSLLRSTESRPEAGQSSSNNKVKALEEERIRASKESRKWLKMGESDDPFHTQKIRKTSHPQ
ncbi:uncharacterized protein LOC129225081 [Uloborus diversus]|uniref:uncharacterized protein LOC129225081 n=1 Tax=Uloborus diversus TaxID=327109 RepID=UPI00240A0FA3|nr:uncharacterized protein LOC129225081 [Uloborus diversus]